MKGMDAIGNQVNDVNDKVHFFEEIDLKMRERGTHW
jgi:hypothetical protein